MFSLRRLLGCAAGKPSRRRPTRLRLEALEDRLTPAHNITISTVTGSLTSIPAGASSFADTGDYLIAPSALNAVTTGTIVLQANNDITVSNNIALTTGVSLTALAGRNLTLTGSSGNTIDYNTGSLDLRANHDAGVNQANRDAGDAALLLNAAVIQGHNTGAVSLTGGSGDNNTHPAASVQMSNSSSILGTQNITLTGTGTATVHAGVTVATSTLTAATSITITGTGFNGAGPNNIGVSITGAAATTSAGTLSITGTGAGTGDSNQGVVITAGEVIHTTGAGAMTITGTGANIGTNDTGVVLSAAGTTVESGDGAITITGTGGSFGNNNAGILVQTGAAVLAIGSGSVALVGQGQVSVGAPAINTTGGTVQVNTGNVTLTGDQVNLGAASSVSAVAAGAAFLLKPKSVGRAILIGESSNNAIQLVFNTQDRAAISGFTSVKVGTPDNKGTAALVGRNLGVTGFAGNDLLYFQAGSTSHGMNLNGTPLFVDASLVDTLAFVGNGGVDTVDLTGQGNDTSVLNSTTQALSGSGYTFYVGGATFVVMHSSGNSTATFAVTANNDTFVGRKTDCFDYSNTGTFYQNAVTGFKTVTCTAPTGSNAGCFLQSTTGGGDALTADGGVSRISDDFFASFYGEYPYNGSYLVTANGFKNLAAYTLGPNCHANFFPGSNATDIFVGRPDVSYITFGPGSASFAAAAGFQSVTCNLFGNTTNASAFLATSSQASDVAALTQYQSEVKGANSSYVIDADNFSQVNIFAVASNQTANLQAGTASSDFFSANGTFAAIVGTGSKATATGFDKVNAYGGAGTTAYLTTGTGNDFFSGTYNDSAMSVGGRLITTNGFQTVNAYAGSANSVADFYDSVGNDSFTGSSNQALLTAASPGYTVQGFSFGTVRIHSSHGGTDTSSLSQTNPVTYTFAEDGNWM